MRRIYGCGIWRREGRRDGGENFCWAMASAGGGTGIPGHGPLERGSIHVPEMVTGYRRRAACRRGYRGCNPSLLAARSATGFWTYDRSVPDLSTAATAD